MTREQASEIIAFAIAKPYSDEPPTDMDHAYAARLAQALDALGLIARRKTPRPKQGTQRHTGKAEHRKTRRPQALMS